MTKYAIQSVVVAGGAGFIGSNFARLLIQRGYDRVRIFDKLTYAGNPANFADLTGCPGFSFIRGDICDFDAVVDALSGFDALVNFAAETHVDRSLMNAGEFIQTDVYGVFVLLEAVRTLGLKRFVHVSTDEVYGDIESGAFTESDPLAPRNPYAASKGGGEMMITSYVSTYGTPVIISRGSNTYGPYQYPEKLLPLAITNAVEGRQIPIYGDGNQVRDWLHVSDHAAGIELLLRCGKVGEIYNIGGSNERRNIDVVLSILDEMDAPRELIEHVTDRRGHDIRYALDTRKIRSLGWTPQSTFSDGLSSTIGWYKDNLSWWQPLKNNAEFERYYNDNYATRKRIGPSQCST